MGSDKDISIENAENTLRKRRRNKRKQRLEALIKLIEEGKFDSRKLPADELLGGKHRPRQEYISPEDRSSYNYGYMQMDEMLAGTPNVWR